MATVESTRQSGDDVEAVAVMLLCSRNPSQSACDRTKVKATSMSSRQRKQGSKTGGVVDQLKRHGQRLISSETARPRSCQWRPNRATVMTTIAGDT